MPWMRPLEIGDKGKPVAKMLFVNQVVDAHSFIGKSYYYTSPGQMKAESVFVSGFDTTKLVDGKALNDVEDEFEVVGTKRYATAAGSKQVLELKRIIK